jgi:hypothetical protein
MTDAFHADQSGRNGRDRDAQDTTGGNSRFHDAATMSLLRRIMAGVAAMAQDEAALLRAELTDTGKSYASAGAAGVIALVMAGALVNFLGLAALAALLLLEIPVWAAALICAAGIALILIATALYALGAIRATDPVPRRTIRNIQRDVRAMRDALRQEGR